MLRLAAGVVAGGRRARLRAVSIRRSVWRVPGTQLAANSALITPTNVEAHLPATAQPPPSLRPSVIS